MNFFRKHKKPMIYLAISIAIVIILIGTLACIYTYENVKSNDNEVSIDTDASSNNSNVANNTSTSLSPSPKVTASQSDDNLNPSQTANESEEEKQEDTITPKVSNSPQKASTDITLDNYSGTINNIGDTVTISDGVNLTVNSSRSDEAGNVSPKGEYYYVNCTFDNQSSEDFYNSTMLNMYALDQDGIKYNYSFGAAMNGSLDGDAPAGGTLSGEIAFDIPKETTALYFCFADPFTEKVFVWQVK